MLLTIVHNDAGFRFNVVLVRKGERYGLNGAVCHNSDEPLVEFYDARYPHTEHGQFVSRYNAHILTRGWPQAPEPRLPRGGLMLDTASPAWVLSVENMREVYRALAALGFA